MAVFPNRMGCNVRCYLVRCPASRRYASTNAEAKIVRDTMVERLGYKKKEVKIEKADIASDKASMIKFINSLLEKADGPQ